MTPTEQEKREELEARAKALEDADRIGSVLSRKAYLIVETPDCPSVSLSWDRSSVSFLHRRWPRCCEALNQP